MKDGSGRGPEGNGDLQQEESVIEQVRRALGEIEFGSILIKIHQGKVVALETSTKVRLDS